MTFSELIEQINTLCDAGIDPDCEVRFSDGCMSIEIFHDGSNKYYTYMLFQNNTEQFLPASGLFNNNFDKH